MKCRTISTEHYETIPKLGSEFRHILNIELTSQTVSSQNHKIGKECHEHCTTFHYIELFLMKSTFNKFHDKGCMHLHP